MSAITHDSGWNPAGRFGRRSYLAWNMLIGVYFFLIGAIAAFIVPDLTAKNPNALPFPFMIAAVFLYGIGLYFTVIFSIRRLHDRDHSGWLVLLFLVPLLNLLLMLYMISAPGNPARNIYGQARVTRGWETAFALLYGLSLFFVLVYTVII